MPRRWHSHAAVKGGVVASAAALALACGAAVAQPQQPVAASVAPPAEKIAVAPGGVDMRTGQYAYTQTDLSIGEDNETGGLALTRSLMAGAPGHINGFANFTHNWDIVLIEKRVDIPKLNFAHGSGQDYRISVRFAGRSETFDSEHTSAGFQQVSNDSMARLTFVGTRSSASVVYTFQAADGTIATFRPLGNGDCSSLMRCAYVSEIVQPDGTRFTFGYENPTPGTANTTRLRSVVSTRGYALLLQYGSGADWNQIAGACLINLALTVKPADNSCPAGALATSSYSYMTLGGTRRLAGATDAANATWTFAYAAVGGGTEMGFINPGEETPWLTNSISYGPDQDGALREVVGGQVFADGRTYSYEYDDLASLTAGAVSELAGGAYTDNEGNRTVVRYGFPRRPNSMNPPVFDPNGHQQENFGDAYFQLTPGPVEIIDPLNRTTTFDYCDRFLEANLPPTDMFFRCVVSRLQSFTDPAGIRTELTYDGFRNVIQVRRITAPGSGLADIVTAATYSCLTAIVCARPVSRTDANGNTTNYDYDPIHGGVVRETLPAPGPGAPRPQTRHEYAQRHAWISNGAGGYEQAATPIWVPIATSLCRTSAATGNPAAPCATAGDEVRTIYDYGPDSGPNNLLLRGIAVTATDGGVATTLRTCYGYDPRGRRISETAPRAGLASCP